MRRPLILISIATLLLAGFSHATLPPGQLVTPAQLNFDWIFSGDQQGAELGTAVSGAGDVNGDGFADVIIGAPKYETDAYKGGVVFGFYGSPAGLSLNPTWSAGSDLTGARFGAALSGAGDVNGDGFDDVLIGAYRHNNGEPEEGRVYLYHGSKNGPTTSPMWGFESNQIEAQLGYAVSGAGDVNGDGFADVIIGARWWDSEDLLNAGAVLLFYGSVEGLPAAPNRIITGTQANASFGQAVSGAGDVNGDGFDDVIIGAPFFNSPATLESDAGAAYLFLGSAQGLAAEATWIGFGPHAGAEFGSAVSSAGDSNGDGFADVVIGAPYLSDSVAGVEDSGGAYLYRGTASGLLANPQAIFAGPHSFSRFGAAVASAGDFNSDGFDEFIVGAPAYTGDQSHEGAVFVYGNSDFNRAGEGNKADTEFGAAVATAGDVDDDGCADIIVGAPLYRIETDLRRGRVFVAHGKLTSLEAGYFTFLPIIIKAGM